VLGMTVGALVGIEGYNFLDLLGLGPATGFVSSLVNTRELAPLMASLAFAMQGGCRFTAQLGSMRIAEEIDALESIAIRPIPYLVTTRLIASVVAIVPLYAACLAIGYLSTQMVVGISSGGSTGSYLHYFTLMLAGQDILYSLIKAVIVINLVLFGFAYLTLIERKLMGRMQLRYGPNRVGPYGLLQPIADLVKLIRKESFFPAAAIDVLYILGPFLAAFTAMTTFSVIPWGPGWEIGGYQVNGYVASNSVSAVSDVGDAPALIDAATEAGANQINGPGLSSSN